MENKIECRLCNVEIGNFGQLKFGKYLCESCIDDENLYKFVRYLLNKLTLVNLQKLTVTLFNLPITNEERLVNVVEIIYEKAISGTGSCQIYAKLSKYLSQVGPLFVRTIYSKIHSFSNLNLHSFLQQIKVPSPRVPTKNVYFRTILLNRCHKDFDSK